MRLVLNLPIVRIFIDHFCRIFSAFLLISASIDFAASGTFFIIYVGIHNKLSYTSIERESLKVFYAPWNMPNLYACAFRQSVKMLQKIRDPINTRYARPP